jgi:hypothetical protein
LNGVNNTMATPLLFKSAIKDRVAFMGSLESLRPIANTVQNISLCHHLVLTNSAPDFDSEQIQQGDVTQFLLDALDAL